MQSPIMPTAGDDTGTFDIQDVARMLKISTRSVRRLIDEGAITPPMRVGRLIRWPKRRIIEWIVAGCPAIVATERSGAIHA